VVERLLADDTAVEIAGRTIRLAEPVTGDAGAAALRVLGRAQAAAPVGAAAHAATGVAAAVWRPPHLYLARWAKNRWIVGYRLAGGWTPNDYIRSDGRIPSRLETGNWYLTVPDEVREAFVEVGLSLESPPFPLPELPEDEPAPSRPRRKPPIRSSEAAGAPPRRTPAPKPPAEPKPEPAPTTRVCPGCNMRRTLTQFTEGSDLCVDCR
jgi:cell division septation protein DedD